MEDIYEAAKGKADKPHRHDYYTILLIEEGSGKHIIDYQSFPINSLEVHFISPGQIHQLIAHFRPKGWVLTFSQDFLIENNIPSSFIYNINLFQSFGQTPPLSLDETTYRRLTQNVGEMFDCLLSDFKYRNRALGALLQLFLIYCSNCSTLNPSQLDEDAAGVCIFRDFKQLIEAQFRNWHKVDEYATEIHISSKHLSQTVKNLTGKSAKEFIQDRLLLEAKRLLLHTDLSVKEIGYRLGYEEPLHFSSFFKKQAGISASTFRDQKK